MEKTTRLAKAGITYYTDNNMKKAIIVLIILLIASFLIVMVVARFSTKNAEQPTDQATADKTELTTETSVNSQFSIKLKSNPSTGFSWGALYDADFIELINSTFTPQDSALVGTGGEEVFTFKALKTGETKIEFIYSRKWESVQPAEKKTYTIKIQEAEVKN